MKQNGVLGILVDQNFAAEGVFVNFLGKLASTTPLVSILARRTGAIVLPVHNHWDGRHLRIIWEKPMPLSREADVKRAIQEDTQTMTDYVERWIREDPGQWLWMHNRWKRQPA
jgi:KDO2-lipid IV(A) lauroyltransferase